ncbi:MAG: hypothetical protein R3194_07935, partial [Limnobacter sp.]|nr:hypothetical protein [Limnobacter sp.]
LQNGFAPSARARNVMDQLNNQSRKNDKPVIVIPTYNGARRKPNFTPLLAGLLSQQGYPVLCHGLDVNATGRVSTQEVLDHIEWPMASPPHFCPIGELFPVMPSLLAMQQKLGVRNFTHTLVKMLVPAGLENAFLVTAYTHPVFLTLQAEVLGQFGHTALIIRGHEGEAVAAPYRTPQMDGVKAGRHWLVSPAEASFSEQPDPRPDISAQATAELTLKWLENPELRPHGFARQLDAIEAVIQYAV